MLIPTWTAHMWQCQWPPFLSLPRYFRTVQSDKAPLQYKKRDTKPCQRCATCSRIHETLLSYANCSGETGGVRLFRASWRTIFVALRRWKAAFMWNEWMRSSELSHSRCNSGCGCVAECGLVPCLSPSVIFQVMNPHSNSEKCIFESDDRVRLPSSSLTGGSYSQFTISICV